MLLLTLSLSCNIILFLLLPIKSNVLVKLGEVDAGIGYHQKAIQLKPDWAELHYNLGDALIKQNRLEETFTALQTAIRLKPNLAEAQRLIGNVLMIQGNFSAAITHLQIATQIKPDWSDAHHNLGKALVANGQVKEAIAEYQQAITLTPAWALAYWDLGIAHWLMEQTSETIACFQKTVELHCCNVTLQDSEVRLIYEDLLFSLPYLRDRIDLNGHLNKLMGGAYTQLCLPNVTEKEKPKSTKKKAKLSVQPHYREQLIRMTEYAVAIADFPSKPIDREALRQNLGITSEMVVYLSLATGHKVNPDSVRSHISILKQVPHSVLLHKGFCDLEIVRSLYQQECQKAGIDPERCRFVTRQPLEEDHRSFYQIADIALDTYPYNGGTHNLESLWFNLPIVTLCGEQAPSRMGYSFLKAVGISEGVAKTWEEYINWAARMGSDRNLRMDLQNRIRQSKQPETLSPIWNPQKFAIDSLGLFKSLLQNA